MSLAGADVTALARAATRGGSGQLSWVRTSGEPPPCALGTLLFLFTSCFNDELASLGRSLKGVFEGTCLEGGKTIGFLHWFLKKLMQNIPRISSRTDARASFSVCLFSMKKRYLKVPAAGTITYAFETF